MSAADPTFWAKVDKTGECWIWIGGKGRNGYGQLRRAGRTLYAHRYVLAASGVDLESLDVDHKCFNRACVRPEHLRVVTRKQNLENHQGATRNSKSGVRGVFWDNTFQKWTGSVTHNRKQYRKSFQTSGEAAAWVVDKRLELHTHNDLDRVSA